MATVTQKHVHNRPDTPKAVAVSAQAPARAASFSGRLDQIVRLYKEGVAGSAKAVLEADRLLTQLRADYPNNPLADAYHGGIMILIARDKEKPLEKLRWSKRGLKLLDGAVAAAPEDTMVRLLRGKAAYKLPEKHFRRTSTAIEDYVFLIDQHMRQKGVLKKEEYTQLIYELGEAYYRVGRNRDAANCWRRLEKDPKYRNIAKKKLESVKGKPAKEDKPVGGGGGLSTLIGFVARATGSSILKWVEGEEKKARKKRKKRKH
ncbi:tetratricopeptide repeat protein [Paenibacillus sp. GYB003]|mgnify:CR=1 FL=1|uniref:tetratricopeptide repeat protein n=1 Tax=Paenibacillus sp. GYB003 TaxID=2994392 RepID=UPI002F9613BA